MNILTDMRERLDRVATCEELDVDASELPVTAVRLSDSSLMELLADIAAIANDAERFQAVLAGVAAQRSARDRGHSGLAAVQGHATPASLIQAITGGTKAEANRHVRMGTALLQELDEATDAVAAGGASTPGSDGASGGEGAEPGGVHPVPLAEMPWHAPLRSALLDGRITSAQHDAIRRGLGEPRVEEAADPAGAAVREAWSLAAEGLITEASSMPAEELAKRARTVRDLLDPVGAEERYAHRFEARSYRMWVDGEGQHRASIAFDDEMGLWVQSMLDAALRPRRGGPRFVTEDERQQADELVADPRTNEQLAYDLFVDVMRAGALADASAVFGARQPGVRMVVVKDAAGRRDAFGHLVATGHAEDGGASFPGSVIDRNICANGSIDVVVDAQGNPLDLGREARLYSGRQRLTLAVRDGGCRWPGCGRPPAYCEAHHCDHFVEHEGRTDIDRGVLLCRFHHMLLHNRGWRITRDGRGPFVLHPPPGEGAPIILESKAAWKWAWDPPPPPERAGWRAA
ncbi:HNH endonuclease signature motif containing protein [Microbacterium timonense]|uniref:HNH endonuclease signature motif containing protein n=1 Tax=Microbacterium timonense TaxID=2086576 RepID=UPI001F2827A6|nr:HNH endonuclease signature motif containing protein [Microbacterium timonense]